ncbi:hypothetical protein [Bacillus toyonensis]|uniref:hypothetical protein n=1 Tax=Bacillus toyonensis TaxID=155322 RepID=UPI00240525CD|nr:hypothetical protein [Bacillus toyonensis]MDF9450316.1 hypothetical protein [Bacillus toyonensis]MDG1564342.1 hypothetical protein [Bacillus toyonensis]
MNNGHYEYKNSFHQYYPNESYPFVMDNRNIDMSRGVRPQQWQQLQQWQQQQQQQQQQPQQQYKCQCDGKEALCVSIPVPITVVLLGTKLQVELPCIRITSEEDITPVLKKLIKSLGGLLGGSGSSSS